jgi:serine/threonine-protein kinase RsbW
MSKLKFSQSFKSEQPLVSAAVGEAVDWLRTCAVDSDSVASVEIVLAEALNNVVEHAYEYRTDGQIDITFDLASDVLTVVLFDQGRQFPGVPQMKTMMGNAVAFADLPEGGFGWFLIHSLTRRIQYAFVEGRNVLSLEMELAH